LDDRRIDARKRFDHRYRPQAEISKTEVKRPLDVAIPCAYSPRRS
jgi:hypothetical protein